jgi:hypothetical protein
VNGAKTAQGWNHVQHKCTLLTMMGPAVMFDQWVIVNVEMSQLLVHHTQTKALAFSAYKQQNI